MAVGDMGGGHAGRDILLTSVLSILTLVGRSRIIATSFFAALQPHHQPVFWLLWVLSLLACLCPFDF